MGVGYKDLFNLSHLNLAFLDLMLRRLSAVE